MPNWRPVIRAGATPALIAAGLTLASCGGSTRARLPLSRWLRWNAGARVATLTLIPGYGSAYNGFNFNGYGKGQVLVTIPQGWKLEVRCQNTASTKPHSCAIVRGLGAQQPTAPGAATTQPTGGVPPGKSATFSFRATAPATYRIASLVPDEERAGMWDVLTVARSGRPSVTLLRR
jgi:hypothetical protein